MNIELKTFARLQNTNSSTLGIASVKFTDTGLTVHEIRVQRRGGGWYCARPSRFPIVLNGVQLQHPEGNLIWRTMFAFDSDEQFIAFSERVVELVRQRHPDLFVLPTPTNQEPAHAA